MNELAPLDARLRRLKLLLQHANLENSFYREKWRDAGVWPVSINSLIELANLPFTTREELLQDQMIHPPLGQNFSAPAAAVRRIYRSSGTSGESIVWADTEVTWDWVVHCSRELFRIAGVAPGDRVLLALPFGAASGSWLVFEGAASLGCATFAVSLSDLSPNSAFLRAYNPSTLVGRPSRLLDLAKEIEGIKPSRLICTSEPCTIMVRDELRKRWGASAFSRYGLTEAGSIASECPYSHGMMHLLENEFIVEVLDTTGAPVTDGEEGELVLTTLGRIHRPIFRYRTGDLVRVIRNHSCECGRSGTVIVGPIRRISAGTTGATNCSKFDLDQFHPAASQLSCP